MPSQSSQLGRKRLPALFVILVLLCMLVWLAVCTKHPSTVSNNDSSTSSVHTVWPGSCKEFDPFPEPHVIPPHRDCMEYTYHPDSTLELLHVNAGFNCCPGSIDIDIAVEDSVITIQEFESRAVCNCRCLFDLEYVIEDIRPGAYTINVTESYSNDSDEPLVFAVDLLDRTSGRYCIERDHDPWYKTFPNPSGSLVGASDCKTFESFVGDSATPANMDCIAYTYNADFTLDLNHINAGFNCCPGQFKTTITANDTMIVVETVESIHGCRCSCLFDLDYKIVHVAPGFHRIKIIEQCLGENDERIDFVVDLSMPVAGIYCVERTHTPWDWPIF